MRRVQDSLIWGIILLLVGLLFLLWNLGVFDSFAGTAELIIAGAFAVVGLGFLASYLVNRQEWWRVIPGFALLAVGGIVYLATQQAAEEWIGALLFIGISLAFAVVYFSDRQEHWWALIPFGTMIVMVAIVLLTTVDWPGEAIGTVLFGGMGLVFLLVYLLSANRSQFRWALIPTSVLLIMALVTLAAFLVQSAPDMKQVIQLWPVLLILVGVLLLGLSIGRSGTPKKPAVELPKAPAASELPAAPGSAVLEVPESYPAVERAPIALTEPAEAEVKAEAEVEKTAGEVPDIYEFLKSAPQAGDAGDSEPMALGREGETGDQPGDERGLNG